MIEFFRTRTYHFRQPPKRSGVGPVELLELLRRRGYLVVTAGSPLGDSLLVEWRTDIVCRGEQA
jgi:hypothetical protein